MAPTRPPAGSGVPDRAGGELVELPRYLSELCDAGEHSRCRHPANVGRTSGCDCPCHVVELDAGGSS